MGLLRSLVVLVPVALSLSFSAVVSAFTPTLSPRSSSPSNSIPTTTSLYGSAEIQFIRGLEEKVIPDIKLTRARDGSSGTATFKFSNPNVFDASTTSSGDVTGMFLVDEEGEMGTTSVNASFVNGKPQSIESVLMLKSPEEWDRFMRFMERYGEANGLGFTKSWNPPRSVSQLLGGAECWVSVTFLNRVVYLISFHHCR